MTLVFFVEMIVMKDSECENVKENDIEAIMAEMIEAWPANDSRFMILTSNPGMWYSVIYSWQWRYDVCSDILMKLNDD